MSGPIVRSGPSTLYSRNWELVFGEKKATAPKKAAEAAKKKAAKKKK